MIRLAHVLKDYIGTLSKMKEMVFLCLRNIVKCIQGFHRFTGIPDKHFN